MEQLELLRSPRAGVLTSDNNQVIRKAVFGPIVSQRRRALRTFRSATGRLYYICGTDPPKRDLAAKESFPQQPPKSPSGAPPMCTKSTLGIAQ